MCRCVPESRRSASKFSAEWLTNSGSVVHPAAPQGVGGPGAFRAPGVFASGGDDELLPHPRSPAVKTVDPSLVRQADELEAAKVVRQLPPKVAAESTETIRGMSVKLMKDLSGDASAGDAITDLRSKPAGKVTYQSDRPGGTVTSVNNGLKWSVEIQTRYGAGTPEGDSAYGRGTTKADKESGNVSLGFHESCHRSDFLNYLRNTPTPVLGAKKDQSTADADKAIAKYMSDWAGYFQTAKDQTILATDEVGDPTLSELEASE